MNRTWVLTLAIICVGLLISRRFPTVMFSCVKNPVLQAMTNFRQALINSNEFLYSD
jgi:hypothetical protein